MTERLTIEDLTPSAIQDILAECDGGVVTSVVIALTVTTLESSQDITLWDCQSSLSSHLGLSDLLHRVMDARADMTAAFAPEAEDG